MTPNQRQLVLDKTGGLCHICGTNMNNKEWQADHVQPRKRGGSNDPSNYLPTCRECNRMKWHRGPIKIRKTIELGLYAFREVKNGTDLGKELKLLRTKRRKENKSRRVNDK